MKKEVYIVGGGPSLLGFNFDLLKDKDTIVINNAIFDVPNPNHFITIDYLFLKKIDIEEFRAIDINKVFVVNLYLSEIKDADGKIIDTRCNIIYDLSDFNVIIKSKKVELFGYSFNDFSNGLNSGFCGIQLAILLGYEKINLLGFDLTCTNKSHYHHAYNKQVKKFNSILHIYQSYFNKSIVKLKKETNIKIVSMSSISKLNNLIEYKEFV